MPTSPTRTFGLTLLAMIAFAANSVLCRIALRHAAIDPASFTAVRLMSGAIMLWIVTRLRARTTHGAGNWPSALALFAYAAAFSYAYVSLPTATGALLLFGAVQITMISHGLCSGERISAWQVVGLVLACAGLVGLFLPGLSAPPLRGAVLMSGAGVAWGIYSLRGRRAGDSTIVTAGNFFRAVPIALVLAAWRFKSMPVDGFNSSGRGIGYAIASGALASGIGYSIWYSALPRLKSTTAATVQLSVPVIAAVGGILFLAEPVTVRVALASIAVLGGIGLVIAQPDRLA
ncbi:MAG: DMT family transporter [Luteimonas sp.]